MTATTSATAATATDGDQAPTTTCDDTLDFQPALPVDRDWIKKLILEHSSNPCNGKGLVVAPMVDQSDYPFRLLCRRYGANVSFTPMMNAGLLVRQQSYKEKFLPRQQHANDRPLIAQLAGHDPLILEQAAKLLLPYVDGIDLNCGCPQGIAKRGFYGAFLLEDEQVLLKCVKHLVKTISKPVTVKVRVLPEGDDASLRLYHKLANCGIHLLTIHGRTRHQLHVQTGKADWNIIQRTVQELGHRIPIFANGNIGSYDDVQRCLDETGVDGVMSSEALLEYPALFDATAMRMGRIQMAKEYLLLAKQYPPQIGHQGSGIKCLKAHIHRFLHPDLESAFNSTDHILRQRVAQAADWQVLWDTVEFIEQKQKQEEHKVEEEELSWYMRHRITVTDAHGNLMTALELKALSDTGAKLAPKYLEDHCGDDEQDPADMGHSLFTAGGGDDDGDY
ncbi:synthase [Seminavis robusta]|uniref:tRNA-dihydrouridine(16/17) synthase [NAD(P)(+)] n=1 Tax=Seminavis robusta TaxID=568900 RepID=A0A9N8HP40_9STRA|nr:synthase [Seminavis robusta]|eukprot:Sro1286_g259400.1 synthase (448) ;mRNA; f:21609-22952